MMRTLLLFILILFPTLASAGGARAIVTKRVIYPGEIITALDIREVEVRNPRPVAEPVIRNAVEAIGLLAKRTLLPKRYIPKSALRRPFLVQAGKSVRINYRDRALSISMVGSALEAGEHGSVVTVRNNNSGKRMHGVVEADGSVTVSAP